MTRFDELQKNLFFALLLFVLMATVPLVITQRYLLGEVITFMLWVSVALQWNVLMGHAGVFSLGQMLFLCRVHTRSRCWARILACLHGCPFRLARQRRRLSHL
jgi:hypothetical protein